jgi:malate dehydrogenase (oxaloacetate-decarboxylating)(NADP+)
MWVAPAVAQAAIETGVARRTIDMEEYLDHALGAAGQGRADDAHAGAQGAQGAQTRRLRRRPNEPRVIRAAHEVSGQRRRHADSCSATPKKMRRQIKELGLEWEPGDRGPHRRPKQAEYAERVLCQAPAQGRDALARRELMRQKLLRPDDGRAAATPTPSLRASPTTIPKCCARRCSASAPRTGARSAAST